MVNKMTKWFSLSPFLFEREPLHLLDISRKLKQNHTTIRLHLNEFVKEGFLKRKTKGRLTLYEINKDFPLVIDYLTIAEKEFLIYKCSQNLILKEIVSELHQVSGKAMIIFGSATGEFSKAQDIDLLTTEKNIDLTQIEKKYNKKIHLIEIKSLDETSETLKKEIIKKHLIINNTEEVVKWLV